MSEHDDELDRWIQRVVAAAGSDAPDHDERTAISVPAPRRRWPVAAAAAVLVALGIGGVVWTTRPDASSPSVAPVPTDASGPSTASSEPATAPAPTASPAPVVTDGATTTAPAAELARPIIDVEWCRPTWARTRDVVFEGAYLWSQQPDMAIQVFVPAGGSMTEQFAVALRVTSNLRFSSDSANAEVNGQPARSSFANPTWGELLWRLPDGSEAYLRTSTMTSDELIALADTFEPRELTDPLPGFDTTSPDYQLAAEATTPIAISGSAMTACETDDGGWMTATVIDGPLGQALYLTDRPSVPMAVRTLGDGRLLLVTGREDIADRSQAVLESVRDATDDEWAALTAADSNSSEPIDAVRPSSVSGVFATVAADRPAVIDLHDAAGVIGAFDLGCPTGRDCVVESARVMGDTIWVTITDTDPNDPFDDVASRVLSVSRTSGEIVEHLSVRGTATARAAGRGADGIVYAYLSNQDDDRQLVAIDEGNVSVLDTGVSGFLLSDDGRFLAVSFSNPPAGDTPRFQVTDLVEGSTNTFETDGINAGPGAWSPDGRHLIVNEQWENGVAWVVDPWAASPEPIAAGVFLDGACFVDANTIAHRTWDVGYGQGDAQTGVIRLTSLDDGSTTTDLGEDLFGDNTIRCHADGSVTYLRRPVIDIDLGGGVTQPEPDDGAPVDLVRIAPDGTATTITSGRFRMA